MFRCMWHRIMRSEHGSCLSLHVGELSLCMRVDITSTPTNNFWSRHTQTAVQRGCHTPSKHVCPHPSRMSHSQLVPVNPVHELILVLRLSKGYSIVACLRVFVARLIHTSRREVVQLYLCSPRCRLLPDLERAPLPCLQHQSAPCAPMWSLQYTGLFNTLVLATRLVPRARTRCVS